MTTSPASAIAGAGPSAREPGRPAGAAIDLVIPARNEEANIPALAAALPWAVLRQVIVVDNGSDDRTAELAAAAGAVVVYEAQHGYGAACLRGLDWIAHCPAGAPDVVAFVDADLADNPALLPQLCQPVVREQADLVIGSRPRLAQRGALTLPQRFGNALACTLIRSLTGQRYSDLGPMRAIAWDSLQQLRMQDRTWGWTVEMQYKAAARGLRVAEMHVPYRPRHAGQSKISGSLAGSVRAGSKILWTIGKLRLSRYD